MNRILYLLVGIGFAVAVVAAFFEQQTVGHLKISETGLALAALFIFALAFAAFVLTYTRWGRRTRWRTDRRGNDHDAEVRANARNKGEVRKPLGPLP